VTQDSPLDPGVAIPSFIDAGHVFAGLADPGVVDPGPADPGLAEPEPAAASAAAPAAASRDGDDMDLAGGLPLEEGFDDEVDRSRLRRPGRCGIVPRCRHPRRGIDPHHRQLRSPPRRHWPADPAAAADLPRFLDDVLASAAGPASAPSPTPSTRSRPSQSPSVVLVVLLERIEFHIHCVDA
jgi:hypothetical protein